MNNMNAPVIIRLELESLRHQIRALISQQALDIDSMIKASLDEFVVEEHLKALVRQKTREVTEACVKDSIEHFFRYGAGGRSIREAVEEKLQNDLAAIVKDSLTP